MAKSMSDKILMPEQVHTIREEAERGGYSWGKFINLTESHEALRARVSELRDALDMLIRTAEPFAAHHLYIHERGMTVPAQTTKRDGDALCAALARAKEADER